MTIFKDTSEFEEFLRGLNPDYEQYAKALWTHGVTSTSQLGNASPPTLLACGVERFIHAEDIVAQSKALGRAIQVPAALHQAEVVPLLVAQFGRQLHRQGPGSPSRQLDPIPLVGEQVQHLGQYTPLQGYEHLTEQVWQHLLQLQRIFFTHADFLKTLQLLRLVAAPGSGKSTVLREVWRAIYARAQTAHAQTPHQGGALDLKSAELIQRVLSSLDPNCMMVFVMNLLEPDMARLHPIEEQLGQHSPTILALRMLYISLEPAVQHLGYHKFLNTLDPRLLSVLDPRDILHFWQQAGNIRPGQKWMAVIAVDEANAAQPVSQSNEASWLQHQLSNGVSLRRQAVETAAGEVSCLPVFVVASTRASASNLNSTASGASLVADMYVPPLSKDKMWKIVIDLTRSIPGAPQLDDACNCPESVSVLFDLLGGNPRLLIWAILSMANSVSLRAQVLPAGDRSCWAWAHGHFDMTVVMTALIDATPQTAWHRWLTGNKVGLLNQVVAHAVCCIPVARNAKVPNSGVTWQDLEQDGIVFMLSPEAEAQATDSESSSVSSRSSRRDRTATGPTDGSSQPDAARVMPNTSGLLVAAAYRFVHVNGQPMPFLPVLKQLADEWQQRELPDVVVLVSRLLLFKSVMGETTVTLRRLLGDVQHPDVPDVLLCIPVDRFSVVHLCVELDEHTFENELVPAMDKTWAYKGPGSQDKPDSWLLLRQAENNKPFLLSIQSQSKLRDKPDAIKPAQLRLDFAKQWQITGLDKVMLYVTDQRVPKRKRQASQLDCYRTEKPSNEIIVSREKHRMFYSDSINWVRCALHMPMHARRIGA